VAASSPSSAIPAVHQADAGRQVLCELVAANDGGVSSAPFDNRRSSVKIPR
jgi:hypothetical protein